MATFDIIVPIEDYNFLTDYDDKFFNTTYPRMWKNICLYVEKYMARRIEAEVRKEEIEIRKDFEIGMDWTEKYDFNVTGYINSQIVYKKLEAAREMMKKELDAARSIAFSWDTYILTDKEKKQIEEDVKRKARNKYITTINKNGLYVKIDTKDQITVFQYRDWEKYNINTAMESRYRRDLSEREEEIIKNCVEVGLHYTWIAKIFDVDERFMMAICKNRGYERVFITPQKLIRKLPRVKVFDIDGFFVIEKENHLFKG